VVELVQRVCTVVRLTQRLTLSGFMTRSPIIEGTSDIPTQIFENFLLALGEASVPLELVARLRKALLEERTFTRRALTVAVLGEGSLS